MSGFFKFLWRLNAVLAFVAAVAAIGFLVLFSKERLKQPLMNYIVPPPVQTVKPVATYHYVLEPGLVVGASTDSSAFNLYRLVRWGKIKGRPVTPEAAATVNILIANKKDNSNAWLFQGFDRAILTQEPILLGRWSYVEPDVDDDVVVNLLILRVVDKDTNGDGVLGASDRQALYICRFDGQEPQKILEADEIWMADQNRKTYLVSYRDKGVAYFATFSIPEFTLQSQTEIKDMPK